MCQNRGKLKLVTTLDSDSSSLLSYLLSIWIRIKTHLYLYKIFCSKAKLLSMLWGKHELEFVQEDVFLGIKLCGVSCPPSLSHRHKPHWFSCLTLAASLGTEEVQRRKIIGLIIMLPALKLISRICKNLLDLNSGKKDELTNTFLRCLCHQPSWSWLIVLELYSCFAFGVRVSPIFYQ